MNVLEQHHVWENKKEQSGGYASWLAKLATTDSDVEALKASGALKAKIQVVK